MSKRLILVLFALVVLAFATLAQAECDPSARGYMPRYWVEHNDSWPIDSFYQPLVVGGITYTADEAITKMDLGGNYTPEKWLFRHTVAAKLNIYRGVCELFYFDLLDTVAAADVLLEKASAYEMYGQRLSREDRAECSRLRRLLKSYNSYRPAVNKASADEVISFENVKALYR